MLSSTDRKRVIEEKSEDDIENWCSMQNMGAKYQRNFKENPFVFKYSFFELQNDNFESIN